MSNTFFSDVPNPKQNSASAVGRHTWYPYYAGYSPLFVRKILECTDVNPAAVVCDPWNGAGTTTQVAHDMGFSTVGFDLNPVMAVVARSRLVTSAQILLLKCRLANILRRVHIFQPRAVSQSDPLGLWMQPCAILAVRHLENAIREEFCNEAEICQKRSQPWDVTKEIAFFFTAAFRCLLRLSKGFRTSNPTWLKIPRCSENRLSFVTADLTGLFAAEVSQMFSTLDEEFPFTRRLSQSPKVRIEVASSNALPLNNHAVDIVVTSPPYCTRIDYAVSTGLELAFLGFDYNTSVRRLRDQMVGTATVRAILPEEDSLWGPTCHRLIEQIRHHSSKASQSYYLKIHLQYFHDIFCSLSEIDRVLRRGSDCFIVVQDSYYKDIHNDLASIIIEMSESIQWQIVERQNFSARLVMARVNRHTRRYRLSSEAVESVLWFKMPKY